jgi:hypothetical protein
MSLKIIDVGDQVRELTEYAEWLRTIGAKIDGARFGEYLRVLGELAKRCDSGDYPHALDLMRDRPSVYSMYEAVELISTCRALRKIDDPELHRRLAEFASGPADYSREKAGSSSNRARDVGFELSVAGRLASADIQPFLDDDGDVRFMLDDRQVFVECKRPQSGEKVEACVRKARQQLVVRYNRSEKPQDVRGIVALNATKVMLPRLPVNLVPTRDSCRLVSAALATEFVKTFERHWIPADGSHPLRDPRTIGVLVEVRCVVLVNDGLSAVGGTFSLDNRPARAVLDADLVLALAQKFDSDECYV